MSATHLFLSCPPEPCPERWREAFPDGRVLEAAALAECLRGPAGASAVVWLGSASGRWPERLREIRRVRPGACTVLLSNEPAPPEGLAALDEGVRGYTHAYAVPALLREVALVVEHGGLWVGPDLLQRLVGASSAALARRADADARPGADADPAAWAALSAREAEVARAVMAGRSNKEVAALMKISERTVKAHLGMVFERLGVRDRLQLVLRLSGSLEPGKMPRQVALT